MSTFLLVALGTLVYYHNLQPIEVLQIRGITVEIYGENTEYTKQYLDNINSIDDYLVSYADKIVLTTNHVDDQAKTPKNEKVEAANAVTVPQKKEIYINTNSYDSLTMQHEFYHLFDYYAKDSLISEDTYFQAAVKADVDNLYLSEYQGASWSETFVACMIQYRYFNQRLESECPRVYEYIDTLLESIKNGY